MSSTPLPFKIFCESTGARYRQRAASRIGHHDFLIRDLYTRIFERLGDIRRQWADVLNLGCHGVPFKIPTLTPAGAVVHTDHAPAMLTLQQHCEKSAPLFRAVCHSPEQLPFAPASFDLVISVLGLQRVNDLPGMLMQIRQCLKPDGLFLGIVLGGDTLTELRHALALADLQIRGGTSPHLAPLLSLRDGASLMQRAGFALPVVDREVLEITYEHLDPLLRDLRHTGYGNTLVQRGKGFSPRNLFKEAQKVYPRTADGKIPATVEIFYLTGWAPAATQQQPLRPGSAQKSLAQALADY